ncbi:MAG: hypothetical protein WKF75_18985 [Singulisphaera sp.]
MIADRFAEELAAAMRAARPGLRPVRRAPGRRRQVPDGRLRRQRYSVPRPWAYRTVTVKGYVDRVAVVGDGRRRRACPMLRPVVPGARPGPLSGDAERRPAALDHAGLPRLGAAGGLRRPASRAGDPAWGAGRRRQFIRVLQLLGEHPQARVERAIRACQAEQVASAEAIEQRTGRWRRPRRDDHRRRSFT